MIINNFIYKIIDKDLKQQKYKNIKTRFAPEPNGYLHLGHAKSIYLNYEIANYFNGICNLRFDDTNPDKENLSYINAIIKDINWLGYNFNKIYYTSNYFFQLYIYAKQLIKKRLAYVDELSSKQIKILRGTLTTIGKNSPYRNRTIKENLILFEKMKNGEYKEGKACLRAIIDMKSKYILLRDPIIYRIKYNYHHNTQNQWCIYPMYDFAHCISDYIENITHSLCTTEFIQNRILYNWILNNINVNYFPTQYEFSRLNISYNIMSKRKLIILLKNNIINNWDDPRMITISGLRRRGYNPECIKKFCYQIGISKQENRIPFSKLEHIARKYYNKIAYRIMAVLNPIKIIFDNINDNFFIKVNILNIPNNLLYGKRKIIFTNPIYISNNDFEEKIINNEKHKRLILGSLLKLRYIPIIIKIKKIKKYKNGKLHYLICSAYYNNNIKKIPIIQWVSQKQSLSIKCYLYSQLFKSNNPELNNNLILDINEKSLIIKNAKIENNILNNIINNNIYQFERLGYFILDKKFSYNKSYLIFNLITKLKNNYYL